MWAIYIDRGTSLADSETFTGWSVFAQSLHGKIDAMFGPIVTTPGHHAFAKSRTQSNNTAEMTAMVEGFSFLGRPWSTCPSCFHLYDSKHALGVRWGTIQARTNVQLGLSRHQSLLNVQHKLRFTMQEVYHHAENLGNECADHAAALSAFNSVSNDNFHMMGASLLWFHCFATCPTLGDVLEKSREIRTEHICASEHRNKR